jgi:hypothetical protein
MSALPPIATELLHYGKRRDQREWTKWQSGTNLVEAAVHVDPFKGWVQS